MAVNLLALPNELLVMIARYLFARDLENFTSINRRMYEQSQEIFEEHRQVKRQYSVIDYDYGREPLWMNQFGYLAKIVVESFQKPSIGSHLSLSISSCFEHQLYSALFPTVLEDPPSTR